MNEKAKKKVEKVIWCILHAMGLFWISPWIKKIQEVADINSQLWLERAQWEKNPCKTMHWRKIRKDIKYQQIKIKALENPILVLHLVLMGALVVFSMGLLVEVGIMLGKASPIVKEVGKQGTMASAINTTIHGLLTWHFGLLCYGWINAWVARVGLMKWSSIIPVKYAIIKNKHKEDPWFQALSQSIQVEHEKRQLMNQIVPHEIDEPKDVEIKKRTRRL